ncbi:uridine kinase [Psychrosphaera haliotis]|nr:uridine kinase [Psychrosphaera haliotis]
MKTTILAITGASASGKTLLTATIFEELAQELGSDQISFISEDAYYRNQDHLEMSVREKTNYDHPEAFEHDLLIEHLRDLKLGKAVEMPQYCYKTHTRLKETTPVQPAQVILIEGIMLLTHPELYSEFDIKVFMDTPPEICLVRRLERDIKQRGRSFDSVIKQYLTTVRPMYQAFIAPSKQVADLIVTNGGKNRIAIDVLKAQIKQLLLN